MSLMKTKPKWHRGDCVATDRGWVNPANNEVLVAIGNLKSKLEAEGIVTDELEPEKATKVKPAKPEKTLEEKEAKREAKKARAEAAAAIENKPDTEMKLIIETCEVKPVDVVGEVVEQQKTKQIIGEVVELDLNKKVIAE